MRPTCPSALALAVAALAAGCGGEARDAATAPTSAVEKAAYVARLDRLCRTERERERPKLARAQRRLSRDGELTVAEVTELNAAAVRAARPLIARIAAVPRPRDDAPALERYLGLNRESLAANEQLVRAGRAGDRAETTRLARRTVVLAGRIAAAADEYGFRECGSEFDRVQRPHDLRR